MKSERDLRTIAMVASLAVAVLMLVGKLYAYWITDSAAIFSDAAESIVHIFATGLAAFSLWYSRVPADQNHPYGHGKIAYFSAGFEGALISVAGVGVILIAIQGFVRGPQLQELKMGLAITLALAIVNLLLGTFLVYVGKRHNSLVLIANGKHVLTDMWTSFGVVGGIAAVHITGIQMLDPIVALLLGLHILREAYKLIRRSFGGLLDEVRTDDSERIIEALNAAREQGLINEFHQLRHRITNEILWIEVHALLPDDMPNLDAHARATELEQLLEKRFPNYRVNMTVHVEPLSHGKAHPQGHPMAGPFESQP